MAIALLVHEGLSFAQHLSEPFMVWPYKNKLMVFSRLNFTFLSFILLYRLFSGNSLLFLGVQTFAEKISNVLSVSFLISLILITSDHFINPKSKDVLHFTKLDPLLNFQH